MSTAWIRAIAFFCALIAWVAAEVLSGFQIIHAAFWISAILLSVLTAWLAGALIDLVRGQRDLAQRLTDQEKRSLEVQHRLDSVIELNHQLVEVEDEKTLVDTALDVVSNLTGALASSFVPLDEMGEPLSPIARGSLPQPILKAWAEHLASQLVRKTCGQCQDLHADAGQVCPLLQGPFVDAFSVYCLPMRRGERIYGLLNVYFGPHHHMSDETRVFLESLLMEMGNALQVVRLRRQELATLQQIQLSRANRSELSDVLGDLLENLRHSFEMDAIRLQARSTSERQTGLDLWRGNHNGVSDEGLASFFTQIVREGQLAKSFQDGMTLVGAPLVLPEGQINGAILLVGMGERVFLPHQLNVLQTVANQAALLIESERARESLEFAIVIQERTRLAREIHDGLAQTLAFLKLQTAQMQRAFRQNDLEALKDLLDQNYNALAGAYLDARQAIDNLRLNPQKGLIQWLEQATAEFENLSNLAVRRSFEPLSREVPTEVQAQLVRIVQEIYNNIRKHANAKQTWIMLKEWEGDLVLEVGDDGQGFQPDDIPGLSQHGLRGMRERAELIGADFQVTSRIGEGTVVYLRLPARMWEAMG